MTHNRSRSSIWLGWRDSVRERVDALRREGGWGVGDSNRCHHLDHLLHCLSDVKIILVPGLGAGKVQRSFQWRLGIRSSDLFLSVARTLSLYLPSPAYKSSPIYYYQQTSASNSLILRPANRSTSHILPYIDLFHSSTIRPPSKFIPHSTNNTMSN